MVLGVRLKDVPAPPGIPPWSVMVVAETVTPEGEAAANVALVYATEADAQAAVDGIAAGWTVPGQRMPRTPEEVFGAPEATVAGTGPFVVLVTVRGLWTTEGPLLNMAAQALWNAIITNDLALFAPPP